MVMMKLEICVILKASTQPCGLRCLARESVGLLSSCLTKPKNELYRQLRVSIEVGKFIKWKEQKLPEKEKGPKWVANDSAVSSGFHSPK
jgi:hypothetical protein